MSKDISGPAWDNASEYSGFDCGHLAADKARAVTCLEELEIAGLPLVTAATEGKSEDCALIPLAITVAELAREAYILINNISTFAMCALSVDASDLAAQKVSDFMGDLSGRLKAHEKPLQIWLGSISDALFDQFISDSRVAPEGFMRSRGRLMRHYQLSLKEEQLVAQLSPNGLTAWGRLYTKISSLMRCEVKKHDHMASMGLSQAVGLLADADSGTRAAAFQGINSAWQEQQEYCATILNAMVGWRLELYRKRSHQLEMTPLTPSLLGSAISAQTLEAMMSAVKEFQPTTRQALRTKAARLGKDRLACWDLFAPLPNQQNPEEAALAFADAVNLIANAFAAVDEAMAEFVHLMVKNKWIEGRVAPNKMTGAYCTKFLKSRTPRVYMVYQGTFKDVITLAHELGHAYHNWVMRDMPVAATIYPMTLAETASIICQTLVVEHLRSMTAHREAADWAAASDAEVFTLNIPLRLQFEQELYARRSQESLAPADLSSMMATAWRDNYGDSLSCYDEMFWASKLHFYISGMTFYNYPYTFGYLFSLGVYGLKQELGVDFAAAYRALLRDTGRMTVEDLAAKHLQQDLAQPGFWRSALAKVPIN